MYIQRVSKIIEPCFLKTKTESRPLTTTILMICLGPFYKDLSIPCCPDPKKVNINTYAIIGQKINCSDGRDDIFMTTKSKHVEGSKDRANTDVRNATTIQGDKNWGTKEITSKFADFYFWTRANVRKCNGYRSGKAHTSERIMRPSKAPWCSVGNYREGTNHNQRRQIGPWLKRTDEGKTTAWTSGVDGDDAFDRAFWSWACTSM